MFHVFLGSADVGALTACGEEGESLENLKFTVNIESLALVLYSNDPKQVSETFQDLASKVLYKSEHNQGLVLTLWDSIPFNEPVWCA